MGPVPPLGDKGRRCAVGEEGTETTLGLGRVAELHLQPTIQEGMRAG